MQVRQKGCPRCGADQLMEFDEVRACGMSSRGYQWACLLCAQKEPATRHPLEHGLDYLTRLGLRPRKEIAL